MQASRHGSLLLGESGDSMSDQQRELVRHPSKGSEISSPADATIELRELVQCMQATARAPLAAYRAPVNLRPQSAIATDEAHDCPFSQQ